MAPLPLFKLGALLAKQISKPLAKLLKVKAVDNNFLKNYLIIPSANLYHTFDIKIRMRVLGLGTPDKVPVLSEKAAIELGADLLSEFFVFGTAAGAIILEYLRQSKNKTAKDTAMAQQVEDLGNNNSKIFQDVETNAVMIQEMSKLIKEQTKKIDSLTNKVTEIEEKIKEPKRSSQSTQTALGRQIGKILYATSFKLKPCADVTTSLVFQSAEDAVFEMTRKSLA